MKKIVISIITILLIVIIIYISFYNKLPQKYICTYEKVNKTNKTIIKYEATLDENDNIKNFYGEKKYILNNESDFENALYSISTRDVDYTGNKEELTITIHITNGQIINENGEVIYPNYLEYIKNYINDDYDCKLDK